MTGASATAAGRATSDIAIQLASRALNIALGIVVTVALVRHLGDDGFGRWATIFAVVEVVGYLSEMGLEQLAVRNAAADRERAGEWLGGLVSLRLLIAVPVTVICLAVLLPLAEGVEMQVASVLVAATNFTGAVGASRGVFQVLVRNGVVMGILTVNSLLWLGAALAVMAADGGLVPLAAVFLAVAVVTNGLQFALATRTTPLRLRPPPGLWRELVRIGLPLGIAGLLTLAYVRIDAVLLFSLAGPSDAGYYSAAYRILDRAQFLAVAVITTVFPLMAAARATDRERVRALFGRASEALLALTLPGVAFALVAAEPLVRVLFGDELAPAADVLPILMGAFVAVAFVLLATHLLVVLDRHALLIRYALAGLVVNVALNVVLVPEYGFVAAAWIAFGTHALVAVLGLRAVVRALGPPPAVRRLGRSVLAAAVLGALLWGLGEAGVGLAGLLIATAVAYPALLLLAGVVQRRDLALLGRRV